MGEDSTTTRGRSAEALAAQYLQAQGYRILARNYRARGAEVDIVAEEGDVLCFVEVRSRRSSACGDPLETVDHRKQARVIRGARHYLAARGAGDRAVRFDVVGIVLEPSRTLRLLRGAFEVPGPW
jgi:putative endonuclease